MIIEGIDGVLIRSIVQKSTGSAGPSGLDAAGWRRICSSFGQASHDLCSAIARVARRLKGRKAQSGVNEALRYIRK